MADKITQGTYVELNLGFIDEDTRKVKIPNAKTSYATSDFTALEAALKPTIGGVNVDFVIGDRSGAAFTGILTADKIATKKTDFDLAN